VSHPATAPARSAGIDRKAKVAGAADTFAAAMQSTGSEAAATDAALPDSAGTSARGR
jgi:hypothetical protein